MTLRAAVIGHPVGHSLSPLIHGHWIARYGVDAVYSAIDVPSSDLERGVAGLVAEGFAGFNVTLPHKQSIMAMCDSLDDAARAVGAVNMVEFRGGRLHGCNTDAHGFVRNLREACPDFDISRGPALILGAGGAARAAIHALLEQGVPEIILCNRTAAKAESLVREPFCKNRARSAPWLDRAAEAAGVNLIVQTTSLGMVGQDPLEMDLSRARADCVVYDVVYRPLLTGLLWQAKRRNMPVVNGLGMLLHQARPAFQAWFGILPEIDSDLRSKAEGAAQT